MGCCCFLLAARQRSGSAARQAAGLPPPETGFEWDAGFLAALSHPPTTTTHPYLSPPLHCRTAPSTSSPTSWQPSRRARAAHPLRPRLRPGPLPRPLALAPSPAARRQQSPLCWLALRWRCCCKRCHPSTACFGSALDQVHQVQYGAVRSNAASSLPSRCHTWQTELKCDPFDPLPHPPSFPFGH